jgi:hypothetical protein
MAIKATGVPLLQAFPVPHRAIALGQAIERPEHHIFTIIDGVPAGFADVVVADIIRRDMGRDEVLGEHMRVRLFHGAITPACRAGSSRRWLERA